MNHEIFNSAQCVRCLASGEMQAVGVPCVAVGMAELNRRARYGGRKGRRAIRRMREMRRRNNK